MFRVNSSQLWINEWNINYQAREEQQPVLILGRNARPSSVLFRLNQIVIIWIYCSGAVLQKLRLFLYSIGTLRLTLQCVAYLNNVQYIYWRTTFYRPEDIVALLFITAEFRYPKFISVLEVFYVCDFVYFAKTFEHNNDLIIPSEARLKLGHRSNGN